MTSQIWRKIWVGFLAYKSIAFIFLYPLLLAIIPITIPGPPAKGAFILLLMAGYWLTEVIPIYVTALFPILLAPLLGLTSSLTICPAYMKDSNMLFVGGLVIACAIEHHNLQKRVALFVLKIVGSDPKMLMLGFMIPTWFLSMWMSNTATTAMMITIVEAVLNSLASSELPSPSGVQSTNEAVKLEEVSKALTKGTLPKASNPDEAEAGIEVRGESREERMKKERNLNVALSLSICYASSVGGIATLTGTPPNSILFGQVNSQYGPNTGLTFGSWMAYGFPISFILLVVCWLWLTVLYFGVRNLCNRSEGRKRKQQVETIIREETRALGKITYAECVCCVLFLAVTILWVTRNMGSFGWGRFFSYSGGTYVTDTQPALLIGLLALILPEASPVQMWKDRWNQYRDPNTGAAPKTPFLLPWSVLQKRFPWGVIFVLGGGFALSDICKISGLSHNVGMFVGDRFGGIPVVALILVCTVMSGIMTEFTANAATASIFLPIMFSLSDALNIHPFRLAFPLTVATSFAFSLPAGTPPNSIVFGKGRIKVSDMMKSGVFLNLVGCLITLVATITYAVPMFDLNAMPTWALNSTKPG